MTAGHDRMRRLQEMAGLVLDARQQALRRANDARDALLRQLAELEVAPDAEGLSWTAAEQARFAYEIWADGRRAEINQQLAAQRVVCLTLVDQTRLAFGRSLALDRLAARQSRPRAGAGVQWQANTADDANDIEG